MKSGDWTEEFCVEVYKEVKNNNLYITNLAKCTQEDARSLPDAVFKEYRDLFLEEMDIVKPNKIILFGNQISSIILNKKISMSEVRKTKMQLKTKNNLFDCYCVYYPVGNGFFNTPKAIEDVKYIKSI